MTHLDLALDAAAVHRLTRLVTTDVLTRRLRAAVIATSYLGRDAAEEEARRATRAARWAPDPVPAALLDQEQEQVSDREWEDRALGDDDAPLLATLVTCRWCASVWVGFGVAVVRRTRWWRAVRVPLALSSASTLLAGLEDS